MKKHLIKAVITFLFANIFFLSGCNKKAEKLVRDEHTFSNEWANDENYHWHPATCSHMDEKINYEKHTFDSKNICKKCKFQKSVNIEFEDDLAIGRVGYDYQYLGEIKRKIPKSTFNEGYMQRKDENGNLYTDSTIYPTYGKGNIKETSDEPLRTENIEECNYLNSQGGTYDRIDKNGYLFLKNQPAKDKKNNQRKLYKHSASIGHYYGNVDDNEPGIIKHVSFQNKGYVGYNLTGIYAPAGEVVTISFTKEEYEKVLSENGLTIYIGQALNNGQENNIWVNAGHSFNRMAVILNKLILNRDTIEKINDNLYQGYIGSYFGGPVYVKTTSSEVSMTISGGVNYKHYIYGKTTRDEFEMLEKSSAPYFDLEVWENGVLISGPSIRAEGYSYDDLYKIATYWDKVSKTSNFVNKQGGIVFIFDCFVAAGAAVAFPGRRSVNCPDSWMSQALNYSSMINSGSWGNMHEYNHNFQGGWGLPEGGEVSNNALNLVSYLSYTQISKNRTFTNSGESGLSGWNTYTSSSRSLLESLNGSKNGLATYSTLLHNIGPEAFINGAKNQGGNGVDKFYKSMSISSGYDLKYYLEDICKLEISNDAKTYVSSLNLKNFIPISSVYQTGRKIFNNGNEKYIYTQQPLNIKYNEDFTVDLSKYTTENNMYKSGSIILPSDFSYKIKNVSQPEYGSIEKLKDETYIYHPSKDRVDSGRIYVTLQISGPLAIDDIDLVLQFRQNKDSYNHTLERTYYQFNDNNAYETAKDAYDNDFAGGIKLETEDNINPTQNSNTDLWVPSIKENAFVEIKGKILIENDDDYRIAIRGRKSCALYVSLDDDKNYQLVCQVKHTNRENQFVPSTGQTDTSYYKDYFNLKAGQFLYFKEILKVESADCFVGLGFGQFDPVIEEYAPRVDKNGDFVLDENGDQILDPIESSKPRTVTLKYATAFRNDYKVDNESDFTCDYLVKRNVYTANNYSSGLYLNKGNPIQYENVTPWDSATENDMTNKDSLTSLFDDNENNYFHSKKNEDVSENYKVSFTVNLNKEVTCDKLTMYSFNSTTDNRRYYLPKAIKIYAGTTSNSLREIYSTENATIENGHVVCTFDKTSFTYYKIVISETYAKSLGKSPKNYLLLRKINLIDSSLEMNISNDIKIYNEDSSLKEHTHAYIQNLNNPFLAKSGEWKILDSNSFYGKTYLAKKSAKIKFKLFGNRFAINQTSYTKNKISVKCDSKSIKLIDNNKDDFTNVPLVSSELQLNKKAKTEELKRTHTIEITFNADTTLDYLTFWEYVIE